MNGEVLSYLFHDGSATIVASADGGNMVIVKQLAPSLAKSLAEDLQDVVDRYRDAPISTGSEIDDIMQNPTLLWLCAEVRCVQYDGQTLACGLTIAFPRQDREGSPYRLFVNQPMGHPSIILSGAMLDLPLFDLIVQKPGAEAEIRVGAGWNPLSIIWLRFPSEDWPTLEVGLCPLSELREGAGSEFSGRDPLTSPLTYEKAEKTRILRVSMRDETWQVQAMPGRIPYDALLVPNLIHICAYPEGGERIWRMRL